MTEATREVGTPIDSLAGSGYVVAVDLGGTKILAAVFASDGRIVARAKKKSGAKGRDPGPVIDRIAECVRDAVAEAGVTNDGIQAIGIGAPGPISPETAIVSVSVNLGCHSVPLRSQPQPRDL